MRHVVLLLFAGLFLAGCANGPKQHTVIDYHSLEPGHGADTPQQYRYGHTDETHKGTGIPTDSIYPPSPSDSSDD